MNGEEIIDLTHPWLDYNESILENDTQSIELYTKSSWFYGYVNAQLRAGKVSKMTALFMEDIVKLIQKAKPYPKEICFYRGVTDDYLDFIKTLKIGDSFISRGLNSETLFRYTAEKFAGRSSDLMVICHPKGSRFLYLSEIGFEDEAEILTFPNGKLTLREVKKVEDLNLYIFDIFADPKAYLKDLEITEDEEYLDDYLHDYEKLM